jgi:two-component system sensor histidine kinase PilS (NtrC family)
LELATPPAAPAAAPPGAAESPEARDLHRKLLWLAAFRIAAVTVLIGTTALLALQPGEPLGGRVVPLLSILATFTNALQIGVVVLLRFRRWLRPLAVAQIAGDVVFAAFLVYLTGGADSLFTFMFLLAIVNGSVLLGRFGAWTAAAGAWLADWGLVLALQYAGLVPADTGLAQSRIAGHQLAQLLVTHATAFALTAVLASYFAGQVRRAGERARRAERSLEELSTLHDAIVRSLSAGIVTADEASRITFVNRAGVELLGTPLARLEDRPIEDVFPELRAALLRALETGASQRTDFPWSRPDGAVRVLGFTVAPLLDDRRRRIGATASFQDLTRIKQLEERALRSERLAAVGKLAAGLAHELRNPLASIAGSVELLGSGNGGEADQRLRGIALRETERLNRLVSDFLAYARPAALKPETLDLARSAGHVVDALGGNPQAARVSFERKLAPAVARADGKLIEQVLWNLLLNAVQASPAGGTVTVVSGAGPGRDRVFVRVEDRGPGIAPADQARLFEPFFTTKEGGTGLGLSICHRIVEAHNGELEVESRPGEGARFTVILPAPPVLGGAEA